MLQKIPLVEYLKSIKSGNPPSATSYQENRLRSKISVFWRFTESLAKLSTCKRLQVGSTVISPTLSEVLAIGYNGPATGLSNDSCRNVIGQCGCIHSECNTLVKLRSSESNLILLVTCSPCEQCAGLIANSQRIRWVIFGSDYRENTGIALLEQSNIITIRISGCLPEYLQL